MIKSFYIAKVGEKYVSDIYGTRGYSDGEHMMYVDIDSIGFDRDFVNAQKLSLADIRLLQDMFRHLKFERYELDKNFGNGKGF